MARIAFKVGGPEYRFLKYGERPGKWNQLQREHACEFQSQASLNRRDSLRADDEIRQDMVTRCDHLHAAFQSGLCAELFVETDQPSRLEAHDHVPRLAILIE